MFLQIDDNYAIGSNSHGWHILKSKTFKKEERWEPIRWYGSYEGAEKGLIRLKVQLLDSQSFREAIKDIEDMKSDLSEVLKDADRGGDKRCEASSG